MLVGGKPARASYEVKVGDILEIQLGSRVTKVQVTAIQEHVNRETAPELYTLLSESKAEPDRAE